MRQHCLASKWLVLIFCGISIQKAVYCENEKAQWSKPEQNIQNNDWVPVQGKCPTCRLNRDLESQSTNEQLGNILTPPKSQNVFAQPAPTAAPVQPQQQLQYAINKQPRILPFASSFPQYNSPFPTTDGKQFPAQQTKLAQESQKQFYQFESPFVKQSYSLPAQQLIPQSSIPQQRFPLVEPYPYTLPLKSIDDTTTPRVVYQPKIRFPDSEPPKLIPNNKITSQSTDEIQLLYVPIEATQRGRKNMKEIYQQNQYQQNQYQQNQYQQNQYQPSQYQPNQYQPSLPHGFIAPQYNFQYSPIPKQPETPFYYPSNIPSANNYLQLNPVQQQRPDTIYTNLTKSLLQPYFTINGLYSPLSQAQPLPNKQPEIPYYNMLQSGLYNTNPIKPPEQVFKVPQPLQPRLQPVPVPSGTFLQSGIPNSISTFADVYTPTTTEATRSTDYITDGKVPSRAQDFSYQFVTSSPQTSASQTQNFISDNTITTLPQFNTPAAKLPQKTSQAPFEETTNTNYPVPHQPPLSFYMEKVHNPKINDVLYLLKDAKTIPVLDAVETDPPQVFVGPSELPPPKGYIKFELPYLSSLDYNRIERMIDRLPFFVAPLNFKPPPGYSKIPFPAPHIGSVVLSNNTNLQESLHDKPFDQKFKPPTTLTFSASPELSTITPQLTSQINSLLETPSPPAPAEFTSFKNFAPVPASPEPATPKTYASPTEKITKKPVTNTLRSSTTTTAEPPKRTSNRQRKPIYRGYPTSTSTESVTPQAMTSTTESTAKYYSESSKDNNGDNFVEFSAKGKFNINNSNENAGSYNPPSSASTYQISSGTSPTFQSPADYSNFFSNAPAQDVTSQNQNIFETPKQNQNVDFYSTNVNSNSDAQNFPYYNPQSTVGDTKSVSPSVSQTSSNEPESTQSANFNFGNVKPLSQYNPYNKEEGQQVNYTESAAASQTTSQPIPTNSNPEFNFWTQNQFYKVNPNTVDYFSSTPNYQPETPEPSSSAAPEITRPTRPTTAAYQPEPSFAEQSKEYTSTSTENVEPASSTTHRPRLKQRIYPNRYHQSKHTSTTEKENVDSQSHKTNARLPAASESTYESSSQSVEMLSQSTENHESSTRAEVKPHRRRRPIRPTTSNIVTPVTEVSSSTSRSLRTRPTRHPGSVTERYRPRRPTTSSESTETLNSEWSSYNSFVPSAPATNEISVPAESGQTSEQKQFSSSSWTDSGTAGHISESSSTTETGSPKSTADGSAPEITSWLPSSSKQSEASIYSYDAQSPSGQNQLTVENSIENQTEIASERKDESYHSEFKNTYRNKPPKSTYYEEPTSSAPPSEVKENSNDDPTTQESDKAYSQDAKKDRFSADGQKKAYDPQEEKKAGKRRLAFVRRFRVRPHDVLETAESQNLGRLPENSLQSGDSKVLSKAEENVDSKPTKPSTVASSSTSDEYAAPIEATTGREDDETATAPTTTSSSTSSTTISGGIDEYAMQNDFAQMLSDFLNSNDHSTKTVNNLERNNISTENSISYILSLSNDNGPSIISNSSSAIVSPTSFPSSPGVTSVDDVITITNSPITNTEFAENSTTGDDIAGTNVPDRSLLTSTTTEISLETEICYRGKCVKTKKSKASDLLPVE